VIKGLDERITTRDCSVKNFNEKIYKTRVYLRVQYTQYYNDSD